MIKLQKPNIILLVMDTVGVEHLSLQEGGQIAPNLARLAEEGIFFENCYSNSIWTLPSHYSIFTGKLPSHHGAISRENRSTNLDTLSEKLSSKGYTTVGISGNIWLSDYSHFDSIFDKFSFNDLPEDIDNRIRFEDGGFFKEILLEIRNIQRKKGWKSKYSPYVYFLKRLVKNLNLKTLLNGLFWNLLDKPSSTDDGAEKSNRKLLDFLEEEKEPVFGFVNYLEAHSPYRPPKEDVKELLSDQGYKQAIEESKNTVLLDFLKEDSSNAPDVLKSLYKGEIRYLDRKIDELIKKVESKSDRDTIFIITSDHGENFNDEKGLWGHSGMITEELIHVPLVVYGAGQSKVEDKFSSRDIYDLIISLTEGDLKIKTRDRVITEYWGINSHHRDTDASKYPSRYFNIQKSVYDSSLDIWGEEFEENISEENKNYIELRCGSPIPPKKSQSID